MPMPGRSQQRSLTSFFGPKPSQAPTPPESAESKDMSGTSNKMAAGAVGKRSKRAVSEDTGSSSAATARKGESKRSKVDSGTAAASSGNSPG